MDGFSRGYHALAAIYRSHDLDPELARLSDLLGKSVPAIPFVDDSLKTIQPDLYCVLQQDGFVVQSVKVSGPYKLQSVTDHFEEGLNTLVLLKTARVGGMYGMVGNAFNKGMMTIANSLKPIPSEVALDELRSGPLLALLLQKPRQPRPGLPYHMAHALSLGQWPLFVWLPVRSDGLSVLACY
jgi:hypothetical protein